jgi:hypothetical protein
MSPMPDEAVKPYKQHRCHKGIAASFGSPWDQGRQKKKRDSVRVPFKVTINKDELQASLLEDQKI